MSNSNHSTHRKSYQKSPQNHHQSIDSDDNEPMSNKDLERLSNLWRKMKDSKQNLNLSQQSAALKSQMQQNSREHTAEKNNSRYSSQAIGPPGSIVRSSRNKSSNQKQDLLRNSENQNMSQIQNIQQFTPESVASNINRSNQFYNQQFEEKQFINQQNTQLVNKLSSAQEEIDRCHDKISELLKINQSQSEEIQILQNEIQNQNEINMQQQQEQQQQFNNNDILNQEIQKKNQEILELQKTFNQIELKIQENQQQNQNIIDENTKLKELLADKQQENDRIRLKLEDVEKCIDEIYLERQTKGTILLEVEYLKNDVERLLTLLKSTKEFKDFSNFSKDSGSNIRYLNKMPQKIANNFKSKTHHCTTKGNFQIVEKLLWVPTDAFQYLVDLKSQYNGQFSEECVEEILLGLNNIWLLREQNIMDREKNKYENEINSLKKMLNKHMGFNEVTSKRQISRLKQQLSKVTQEKDNIKKKQQQPDKDLVFFTDAKRIAQEFSSQIDEKEKIIEILQEKLQGMQQNSSDKILYLNGAVWMADRLIQEMEPHKEQIQHYIIKFNQEFENLIENKTFSQQTVFETYKPFVDNIDYTIDQILQTFLALKEQTNKNINKIQIQN